MRRAAAWPCALALAAACGGGAGPGLADAGAGLDGAAPPPDGASAPDGAPADAPPPLAFTSGPTLTLAPNPRAPLAALLELGTNRPTRLHLAITDPTRALAVDFDELAAEQAVPVLGLRAATTHTVAVTATDEAGAEISAELEVTTDPLPADLTAFTVLAADVDRMEPGVTLLPLDTDLLIVDEEGEVVWLYRADRSPGDVRRTRDGTLLMTNGRTLALEIDMLGNQIHRWVPAGRGTGDPADVEVDLDSIHHELVELPDGNLLTLSSELRVLPDYPTSELDPTPRADPFNVVGDEAVLFTRAGEVLARWSLFDVIDPYRIGYDSFGGFWNAYYAAEGGGIDWSHANAVVPDPSDGGLLVSVRHQDAVIKLDADGQLLWILGNHANWGEAFQPYLLTPVGEPFSWQYHQHAPDLLPDGGILLFDNGNYRVSPPEQPPNVANYSRAVEFVVDPERMEVQQRWEYVGPPSLFSEALGDADLLPVTGNVLVTFGEVGRVVEVTRDDPAEVVFDLSAFGGIYRSERLPSLYP